MTLAEKFNPADEKDLLARLKQGDEMGISTTTVNDHIQKASLFLKSHLSSLPGARLAVLRETGKSRLLKPGEQSRVKPGTFEIHPADTETSIAWKNGYFVFSNSDLKAIMQQMERWYDVEVDVSRLPEKRFYGKISREVPLSKMLDMMRQTSNLNFEIKGRRVIVQP